jgi:hypothetical protein
LMQLMPATGRMVGRKEGMGVVSTSLLMNPAVSIRLGTQYLRQQLDSWDGDLFRTLASYNAGPGRVHQWLNWTNYREPAEFVESIPFTETREYVQAVLRNADIYRQLYGGRNPLIPEATGKPVPAMTLAKLVTPPPPPHNATAPAKVLAATRRPAPSKAKSKKAVATRRPAEKKRNPA